MTAFVVVIGILALALLADVYLAIKGGFRATISWWVWTNSVKYPIIPFLLGMLAGHLVWNQMLNVTVTGGCT